MDTHSEKIQQTPNYPSQWLLQARAVVPYAAQALGKPLAGLFALSRSYKAQAFTIVTLMFLIFVAPTIVKSTTSFFIPQETKKALGIVVHKKDRPIKRALDTALLGILWSLGVGGSLFFFWLAIPSGLALANDRGWKLFIAGMQMRDDNPELSRRNCMLAHNIVTDPEIKKEMYNRDNNFRRENEESETVFESAELTEVGGSTVFAKIDGAIVKFSADDIPVIGSSVGPDGRFTLNSELGRGSMGVVYDATDSLLDRRVALKQLPVWLASNPDYVQRFMREAKALAKVNHQNIVQLFDLIEESGQLWMALEFVAGGDLSSRLADDKMLTVAESLTITRKVASGLACAHDAGIIHRDIKPANILLTESGEPKVTDFGIAKNSLDSSMTQEGAALGSPRYMSPEQAEGTVADARSDIYSLGITLYEMIVGTPPFNGKTGEILAQQISKAPEAPSMRVQDIPANIEALILQMLAKDPAERPQNMGAVVKKLSEFATVTSV
ncbi:serine/threonine protein kinase [Gemmatimonas aurantiaca]|nr:serine/threonine protein kinase [Gemmatimonas aurantiaca]